MSRLAAIIVLCAACAGPDWIARDVGCTPPPALPQFDLDRCSDLTLRTARCLYRHVEQDILCEEQLERDACGEDWRLVAHRCCITGVCDVGR